MFNKIKKVFFTLLIAHCSLLFVFAETEFNVRFSPFIDFPNMPQFNTGVGGGLSLDLSLFTFGKFKAGFSAGGAYLNVPAKAGDPFAFLDGKAGLFVFFRAFDRLALQANAYAGVYQFSRGDDSFLKALAGGSLSADFYLSPFFSLFAEGGYTYRVFDEKQPYTSLNASAGIRLNLTELIRGRARVKIEKGNQYRIFPVSWAWYENNPVATVKITNDEENEIKNINLLFFMDSYMGQPFSFAVLPRIPSGGSVEVPVNALFNEVMLGLTENVIANSVIMVQYSSLGVRKEAEYPMQMPIFHRNTLSWDDDRRAAAFVSPRDSAARLFARYVASAVNLHMETGRASSALASMPNNVRYAAAIFEALRLYGINYVVDPSMSFVNLHGDESALDSLTYPYESLYYRGGDCAHLSILFCSLLETLNIETAFITVPGHIYAAFDVGDGAWQAQNQDIIEIDGRRWLPVEITIPEEGFARAWRIGARQWRNWGEEACLFPIRECWEVYPSVTVSASVDYPPEMPPIIEIIRGMEEELRR